MTTAAMATTPVRQPRPRRTVISRHAFAMSRAVAPLSICFVFTTWRIESSGYASVRNACADAESSAASNADARSFTPSDSIQSGALLVTV